MNRLLCLIVFPVIVFAAAAADPGERFDSNNTRLALRLLLGDCDRRFAAAAGNPETLAALMAGEMEKFAVAEAGIHTAEELYRKALTAELAAEREKTLTPFLDKLSPAEAAQFRRIPPARIEERLRRDFPEFYRRARERLIAAEWGTLQFAVRPTPEEVEKFDDARLTALLRKRFLDARRQPLFAENLARLDDEAIRPLIRSVREQRRRQLEFVAKFVFPERIASADEARELLTAKLREEIATWKEIFACPVFPGVANEISRRGGRVVFERAAQMLPRVIAVPDYERELRDNRMENLQRDASLARMKSRSRTETMTALTESLRTTADLNGDAEVARAFEKCYGEAVLPRLVEIRSRAVAEEFTREFAALGAGKWRFPPELVERLAVDTAFGGEYADAVRAIHCFEENVTRRDQLLAEEFTAMKRELAAELGAVNRVYSGLFAQLSNPERRESGVWSWLGLENDRPGLETIRDAYRERVVGEYRKTARRYPDGFSATAAEIDKAARALLAQLENGSPSPEPPTLDTTVPEAVVTRRYRLVVGDDNGTPVVEFCSRRFAYRDAVADAAAGNAFFRGVADAVNTALADDRARTDGFELKQIVEIRVSSPVVSYRFVAELRKAVRSGDDYFEE